MAAVLASHQQEPAAASAGGWFEDDAQTAAGPHPGRGAARARWLRSAAGSAAVRGAARYRMRVGEALGLRHEDWFAAQREVAVVPRINDNRARSKSGEPRTIPVSAELVRLYADYLHGEYGQLGSDYVFVNLWAAPHGRPLAYPAVYDLVRRLRRRTGLVFDPHWFRHSYATRLLVRRVASDATRGGFRRIA